MKNIIFVCTGNTCRSPMAEAIAKDFCNNSNLNIFSRGINVVISSKASQNSICAIKRYNLCLDNHMSNQLTEDEINRAYLILTMTNEHKEIILSKFSMFKNKVYTLYEYVLNFNKDIIDPFGSSLSNYLECANELYSLIREIDFDKI